MTKLTRVKQFALATGLFRPAYALYRLLNQAELSRFRQGLDFYAQLLEPGNLCFDVGANIGKKTELFLKLGASVVAFEPQPDCMRELKARCGNFQDQLQTCQSAVGDQSGEVVLHLLEESSGQASLLSDWEGTPKGTIRVPITTLDQAIVKYGKPDYLKIDVEGYELNVLKGLTSGISLFSFEYHLREREITTVLNCLDYLSQFGKMQINFTPSESMEFATEWMSHAEFLAIFPEDLRDRQGYFYGDIFVQIT
jgi:FkbM family methyltransferase